MGIIQNAINQTLGSVAVLTRLSPKGEKTVKETLSQKEAKQMDKEIAAAKEEQEVANKAAQKFDPYTGKRSYEKPTFDKMIGWGEDYEKIRAEAEQEYLKTKGLSDYEIEINRKLEANQKAEQAFVSKNTQKEGYLKTIAQLNEVKEDNK